MSIFRGESGWADEQERLRRLVAEAVQRHADQSVAGFVRRVRVRAGLTLAAGALAAGTAIWVLLELIWWLVR